MYRELLISIGITCIVSVVLFLYFRNKIGKIEQKVDLMFQLIQEYELTTTAVRIIILTGVLYYTL